MATKISPVPTMQLRKQVYRACDAFDAQPNHGSPDAKQIMDELRECASQRGFKCKARSANMGDIGPQDCNWPMCGCDPYADKVIEALQESGIILSGQLRPRCTKCGSLGLKFECGRYPGDYTAYMVCSDCKHSEPVRDVADFGQFFRQIDPYNRAAKVVGLQQLIDMGLNAFGLQLFAESVAGKTDAKTFNPFAFMFRNIKITLEPVGEVDTAHH